MRIAVLSDTHDKFPASLGPQLAAADEIWHLGDVCDPAVLRTLETLGPPVRVILGNCDSEPGWPVALELERAGVRFYLTHIPPARAPAGAHAVLHGHTHIARDDRDAAGVRWLNPGAVTGPRLGGASFAWLTVEDGKIAGWKIAPV
ncbi:MAG: hypothetical protein RLZZ15_3360 [Verrucomicrobiota bacterium]|jgi:putative phosphoesterase